MRSVSLRSDVLSGHSDALVCIDDAKMTTPEVRPALPVDVVPDTCSMVVDIRYLPGQDPAAILSAAANATNEEAVKMEQYATIQTEIVRDLPYIPLVINARIASAVGLKTLDRVSGRVLDDRLLLSRDGQWLDEPIREREFDLVSVLAPYAQRFVLHRLSPEILAKRVRDILQDAVQMGVEAPEYLRRLIVVLERGGFETELANGTNATASFEWLTARVELCPVRLGSTATISLRPCVYFDAGRLKVSGSGKPAVHMVAHSRTSIPSRKTRRTGAWSKRRAQDVSWDAGSHSLPGRLPEDVVAGPAGVGGRRRLRSGLPVTPTSTLYPAGSGRAIKIHSVWNVIASRSLAKQSPNLRGDCFVGKNPSSQRY